MLIHKVHWISLTFISGHKWEDEEEEEDITEIGSAGPSHQQTTQVQVQQIPPAAADCSTQQTVDEEAAKILKAIFKRSICLSECM